MAFMRASTLALALSLALPVVAQPPTRSWTADNGNGTFTNPLFNEDFPDPDIIRVGEDFYMTGTSMHSMPGLPVFHSRDLVNWTLLSYAFDRIEMGPEYRLADGKDAYGAGIWAPAIRRHNGVFHIFSNINGYGLQIFTATNPAGPWTRKALGGRIYDLGVLFDDDGRIYAVHGYDEVRLIEIKPDLSGFVEGSDRVIIPKGNAMGEGHHFYRIRGTYYIISANYAPVGRMQAARADHPYGPYETATISARETMGTGRGWTIANIGAGRALPRPGDKIELRAPQGNEAGPVPMHQGGIVDLPNGDWWGWSMMNSRSLGRATYLSPVTWKDGWPYFGLPGNLGRSPRTWPKPATGARTPPTPPLRRDDDFAGPALQPAWQWNHVPDDARWSLGERPGKLRLHTLPAADLLRARNSLTQRAIGPRSTATVSVDAAGLQSGDVAGLALLTIPSAQLGVRRAGNGFALDLYDLLADQTITQTLAGSRVHLRVAGDYDRDVAQFSYSMDGKTFHPIGGELRLAWQLKTFQGVRYALFAYNSSGRTGGHADFDDFRLHEPLSNRSGNIPAGRIVTLRNLADNRFAWTNPHGMLHVADPNTDRAASAGARFRVHDRGRGQVALEAMDGSGFLTVVGEGLAGDVRLMRAESKDSLFQWQDMLDRQFMLLSVKTNRYVGIDPETNEPYAADWPGSSGTRKSGTVFSWEHGMR